VHCCTHWEYEVAIPRHPQTCLTSDLKCTCYGHLLHNPICIRYANTSWQHPTSSFKQVGPGVQHRRDNRVIPFPQLNKRCVSSTCTSVHHCLILMAAFESDTAMNNMVVSCQLHCVRDSIDSRLERRKGEPQNTLIMLSSWWLHPPIMNSYI
jgi:hypothetical protein